MEVLGSVMPGPAQLSTASVPHRRSVHPAIRRPALRLGVALAIAAAVAGCRTGQSPELHVLGVHEEPRHDVVFVQVTNPASHAMRLTRLEYTFAAAGEKLSQGEMALARDVPAGEAIVVEVPLDALSDRPMTLYGKLTAQLDQIVQSFSVSAQFTPPSDGK